MVQLLRWVVAGQIIIGFQIPTVSADKLDCSHCRSLDSRASLVSSVALTYKDFNGAWHRQHHSSLVRVVNILCYNAWIS